MAETTNIAKMAALLSDRIFSEFLWKHVGPHDTNWPCIDQSHEVKTHPSDVVFYYDNPYSLTRTYVNTDLKSYSAKSINAGAIATAIESLGKAVSCAEKNPEWQKLYVHQQSSAETVGLLFVYNHDGIYDKNFNSLLSQVKNSKLDIPHGARVFVLGPPDIFWIQNVAYDINSLRGQGRLPAKEECRFYYPALDMANNVRPDTARSATLEMLTGPWILLRYSDPKSKRETLQIYYRNKGASEPEFLYLLDYLSHFQFLDGQYDVILRLLTADEVAQPMFQKAKQEYVEGSEKSGELEAILQRISYERIDTIQTSFSQIELGMDPHA